MEQNAIREFLEGKNGTKVTGTWGSGISNLRKPKDARTNPVIIAWKRVDLSGNVVKEGYNLGGSLAAWGGKDRLGRVTSGRAIVKRNERRMCAGKRMFSRGKC